MAVAVPIHKPLTPCLRTKSPSADEVFVCKPTCIYCFTTSNGFPTMPPHALATDADTICENWGPILSFR